MQILIVIHLSPISSSMIRLTRQPELSRNAEHASFFSPLIRYMGVYGTPVATNTIEQTKVLKQDEPPDYQLFVSIIFYLLSQETNKGVCF